MMKASLRSILTLATVFAAASAIAAEPLLQDGKKTLYQRVLSTPGCKLAEAAGAAGGTEQPAFSRFYVYARQAQGGKSYIQVGPDSFGKTIGWLDESCTVPWKMQMALVFTNPADRSRVLFFKDHDTVSNIIDADDPAKAAAPYYQAVESGGRSPEVLAEEPKEFVNFQKNFYLMPILDGEEVMNSQGFYQRVLQVASVTKQDKKPVPKPDSEPQQLTGFKAAVVFVIDSTISMDPYINRTREAMAQIYKTVEAEGLGNQVKFGLIAFRSSTKAVPGLEYVSKVYVNPDDVKDGEDFLAKAASLKQAKVSSKEFSEDSYAGINAALENVDWDKYGGRYIVLITDAGALDGSDPLSSTGLNAQQLRLEAQHRGVAIFTLHLLTPAGAKNHAQAKAQYNDLAFNSYLNKPLYYPVNTGDVGQFGQDVKILANAITQQVKAAYRGDMAAGSALATGGNSAKSNSEAGGLQDDAVKLGKAMQLAYLGSVNGTQAPPVFQAWISDRDFAKPDMPTAQARVLLTKSQLSDLSDVVSKITKAANDSLISPDEMFRQLRGVAAAMGQDPNKLKQGGAVKIADLGLMGEYLDGIPYKSEVAGMDEDTWKSMSIQEQEKFIRNLNTKLNYYRKYNEDQSRWIPLSEGADSRDDVYPVPLEMLP